MSIFGKAFQKVLGDATANETRLGMPSRDGAEAERRRETYARLFLGASS